MKNFTSLTPPDRGSSESGRYVSTETRPGAAEPEVGRVTAPDRLGAQLTGSIDAERLGPKVVANLKTTLEESYKSGGLRGVQEQVRAIDDRTGEPGDGNGVRSVIRPDGTIRVDVVKAITDKGLTDFLNMNQKSLNDDLFVKHGDKWARVVGSVSLDPVALDRQVSEQRKDTEDKAAQAENQKIQNAAAQVIDGFSQIQNGSAKELPPALMSMLAKFSKQDADGYQKAINEALKDSGLSVKLRHTAGLPGIHGNTVGQDDVEVRHKGSVVQRKSFQFDTVRGL